MAGPTVRPWPGRPFACRDVGKLTQPASSDDRLWLPGYAIPVTVISASIEPIVAAMAGLVATAESIEDEWTYIHDLETVWAARLRAALAERSGEAPPGFEDAVEILIAEVAAITDPHRAIDWLSTFPQVVLVAIGEDAW